MELRNYKLYYIFKSTAWTLAIMPIYWINTRHIAITTYLSSTSIFTLVSLIIDYPFSKIADMYDRKIVMFFGMIFFALSFIFALIINNSILAYMIYLLLNFFSNGIMSGIDISIQHDLSQKYSLNFYNYNRKLSKLFYLITIPFMVVSTILYHLNTVFPFIIQSISICISAYFIFKTIEKNKTHKKIKLIKNEDKITLNIRYILFIFVLFSLVGVFSGIVNFQNRVIPILLDQVNKIKQIDSIYLSALIFSFGNLITAFGLSKQISQKLSSLQNLYAHTIIFLVFLISGILLSLNNLYFIFIGYITISLSKGIYRTYYNNYILKFLPTFNFKSRFMSIFSIYTTILISLITLFLSNFSNKVIIQQSIWIIILSSCFIIFNFCIFGFKKINWNVKFLNSFSGKKIKFELDLFSSEKFVYKNTNTLITNEQIKSTNLNAPIFNYTNENLMKYQYKESNKSNNLVFAKHICHDLADRKHMDVEHQNNLYCYSYTNQLCLGYCDCIVHSHNDLHPNNIILNNNNYYVIDWDSYGLNVKLYDEFSFLWHPNLNISIQERFNIFDDLIKKHNYNCFMRTLNKYTIIKKLINAKITDLNHIKSDEIQEIIQKYKIILKEVKRYENKCNSNNKLL